MKEKILILLASLFVSVGIAAAPPSKDYPGSLWKIDKNANADERLKRYITELDDHDIRLYVPDSMSAVDMRGREVLCTNISKDWTEGLLANDMCKVAVQTDSRNAVYLFPHLLFIRPKNGLRISYVVGEDLRHSFKDPDLDIAKHVEVIANDDYQKYSSADTVMIYRFDFEQPVLDQYKHCIGVYLRSKAHNSLPIKIALTDEGLKNADRYVNNIFEMIYYGTHPLPEFVEAENSLDDRPDLPF